MQEGRQTLHNTENGNGQSEPHGEHHKHHKGLHDEATFEQEGVFDRHLVEHFGELGVR